MPELGKATYVIELSTREADQGLTHLEARAEAATTNIARSVSRADTALASLGPTAQRTAQQAAHPLEQVSAALRATGTTAQQTATMHEGAATRTATAWQRAAGAVKASGAALMTGIRAAPAALASAARSLNGVGKSVQNTGRQIQGVGRGIGRNLTLPLALIGGAAVKMSLDFDSSFTDIRALVGASAEQIKFYRAEVLRLAREGPIGPKALADALYFVSSSGFAGEAAMRVLRASAQAAAAGLGDVKLVADAVTSAVTAYGESNLSAARATDIMVGAVRLGKGEASDLAQVIGHIIAPAENLGIEFEEVAASLSSLSLLGIDFFEGATAIRGVMMGLIKPAQETRDMLAEAGESVASIRTEIAERGLIPTLQRLRDRFGDNKDALGALFPNVRALNGFLALTGASAERTGEIHRELAGNVGETGRAAEAASEGPLNKLRAAWSRLQVALIQLGDILVPVVLKIADAISGLVEKFSELPPGAQKAVVVGIALVAVLGPLISVFGLMTVGIGGMVMAFAGLAAVSAPVLLVVAGVAALVAVLVAAVVWPDKLAAGLEKLGMSTESARVIVGALRLGVKVAFELIKGAFRQVASSVEAGAKVISGALDVIAGILTLDFPRAWNGLKAIVTAPINHMVNTVRNAASTIKGLFRSLWDTLKESAFRAVLVIVEPFSHLPGKLGRWARRAKDFMMDELAKIDARKANEAATKLAENFGHIVIPKFGTLGTSAGEAFGFQFVAAAGPAVANVASQTAAQGKGPMAIWNARKQKWVSEQGQVLKDQQAAWNALLEKNKTVSKPMPGERVQLPTAKSGPTTPFTGGGGGGDENSFELPFKFRLAETRAARTKGQKDDLAALRDSEQFLVGLLNNRKLSQKRRLEIEEELTRVTTAMQGINESISKDLMDDDLKLPDWLTYRKTVAESTSKNIKDNLAVAKAEERFYERLIKDKKTSKEKRKAAKLALARTRGEIRDLEREIAEGAIKDPVLTTPKLRMKLTLAERTEGLKDDIAAERAQLAHLNKQLSVLPKTKKTLEKRVEIMEEITRVMESIKTKQKEMADQQEEINNEGKRLMRAYLAEQASFFSSFGPTVFTQSPNTSGGPQPVRTPGIGGPQGLASGGFVEPVYRRLGGFTPEGTDTVPAMLTPGELVLNQRQVENLGSVMGKTPQGLFNAAKGGDSGPQTSKVVSISTPLVRVIAGHVEAPARKPGPDPVVRDAVTRWERPATMTGRGMPDLGAASRGRPVEVHFHNDGPPTQNKRREAMYAESAFRHSFDYE